MVTTRIRRARRSDAATLTRIAHEKLIRLWAADLTVRPRSIERRPTYCAVQGRKVVGFYALSGARTTRELEHLWIDPAYIGRGVGTVLFTHLLRRLRTMRVTRLEIVSDPNAEGFYRRMGARRVGRVPSRPAGRYLPFLVVRVSSVEQPGFLDTVRARVIEDASRAQR